MLSISAVSLSPATRGWLLNSREPRFFHIFEQACNLINERRQVVSIVVPKIGNGPFNLVLENEICFSRHVSLQSQVAIKPDQLRMGDLTIHTADAKPWNPTPGWETLHAMRDDISKQLKTLSVSDSHLLIPNSLTSSLSSAIAGKDISVAKAFASKIAGLGQGLTPAGDDFILGAIYASWIVHPAEVALALADGLAETAAPLTTSLSAAWLRSAGRGEAGNLWHEFLDALLMEDQALIRASMQIILAIGETSGADALAGFLETVLRWRASNFLLDESKHMF
jgi:hypothetical protein